MGVVGRRNKEEDTRRKEDYDQPYNSWAGKLTRLDWAGLL